MRREGRAGIVPEPRIVKSCPPDGGRFPSGGYQCQAHQCLRVPDFRRQPGTGVDGRIVATLCCSADHLDELVVGHLLTEGIIDTRISPEALSLEISLPTANVRVEGALVPTASTTGNHMITTTSAARLRTSKAPLPKPFAPKSWSAATVCSLAREFAKDRTSHARTRGCHSAYLSDGRRVLCIREDVGRHNAFDKVVGWAFLHGIDLAGCMLYTSGRVPTDMVFKAIRARIPILISKAVATDKAITLARNANLVLICEARSDSFLLVSGNEPAAQDEMAKAI